MELVNPLTAYPIGTRVEDIGGVPMHGVREKQGVAFSRFGWLAAKQDGVDADQYGRHVRKWLRPQSTSVLDKARAEYGRREVIPFPRYWIIEPNASCNRRCPFCPIIVTNRRGNMKWDHFVCLMRECAEHEVYGVSLYQLSEPMLYRGKAVMGHLINGKGAMSQVDIADMVDTAKEVGGFKVVNISTNGDVNNLNRLLGCDVDDVFISIDGLTPDVYAKNRPSASPNDTGSFERTVERVMGFLERKGDSIRPWVRLQIINMDSTRDQVVDFVRHWIAVPGVNDVLVKHLDGMNPWVGDSVVSVEEAKIKMELVKNMPCQHLWAIGSMVADGRYNACCHDARTELTTVDAHVERMRFADWWAGEYMTNLRAEHVRGAERSPCVSCAERDPWLG